MGRDANIALEGNFLVRLVSRTETTTHKTRLMAAEKPAEIPWDLLGVDLVIDATGRFRSRTELAPHLDNGARRVVLSSLPEGEVDRVVLYGVNDTSADARGSNRLGWIRVHDCHGAGPQGSHRRATHCPCDHDFGTPPTPAIQSLNDHAGPDYRRSRAAAGNIIPNSTPAPHWVERALPAVKDKVSGFALNVPVAAGSMLDITLAFEEAAMDADEINALFIAAARAEPTLIAVTHDPIVSSDVKGCRQSILVDLQGTLCAGSKADQGPGVARNTRPRATYSRRRGSIRGSRREPNGCTGGVMRVAINGFGRIGRAVFRIAESSGDLDIVAINDLFDHDTLGYLLTYDTVMGRFEGGVCIEGDELVTSRSRARMVSERDPARLPWAALDVDVVVESTGVFRTRAQIAQHLEAGAKRTLLTVPASDPIDYTVVIGVNEDGLRPVHRLISNASCTTNCLAPVAKVLNDAFGIREGIINTVHAYTNDQSLADVPHSDWRRSRAAAENIIRLQPGLRRQWAKCCRNSRADWTASPRAYRCPTDRSSTFFWSCNVEPR